MAEATKIGQDAAKATITFIENNTRGSSQASRKAVITRVDDAGKALKYVAVKTATAGGAASAEAGNRGDKRKAEEPPLFAGVAPKVAKLATAAEHGRVGMALKTEQENTRRGSSHAVGDSVAMKLAAVGADADVVEMEATYQFPAGDFARALKAVDVLGLQWTTRKQRAALRGATPEQRAIAFLLAERLFAAKMRQLAAAKLYWDQARKYHLVQKGMESAGPHGMAYVNCKAIKQAYKGPGQKAVMEAFGAESGPGSASGALAVVGKVKTASASAGAPSTGVGQVATAPEGAPATDKGKGKAIAASVGAPGSGVEPNMTTTGAAPSTDKGKAVAASVADSDDDDVVIVKVILASEHSTTPTATAGRVTALAAAASAAGVLGYSDDENKGDDDDEEFWDELEGDE